MKNIFLISCCFFFHIFKAQSITSSVLNTNFEYEEISNSQHKFKFHTFFSFGYGSTCPILINPEFSIVNNILYVKGFYNITGIWPDSFCDRVDYVYYNNPIPENVTQIITSTNVIGYNYVAPYIPEIILYENVYMRNFPLNLSIDTQKLDNVIIYPNPTNNFITIQNNQRKTENIEYEIVDLTGRIVKKGKIKFNEDLNIENLSKGNYFIQIETENGEKTIEKLIKN